MTGILAIIVVLGGLIFFHELGHFWVARLFGIGVKTFSVGFGPRLTGFKGGKTQYQLALIPLGGYVSLLGEGGKEEEIPAPFSERESFALRPAWQRLLVVLAGPVFNIILAACIYFSLLLGGEMMLPQVGTLVESSPAVQAGLLPGDKITAINGKTVRWWDDIRLRVNLEKTDSLAVRVERNGSTLNFDITPQVRSFTDSKGKEASVRQIGVGASGVFYDGGVGPSVLEAFKETWHNVAFTGEMLGWLFSGQISAKDIGGPVLIAQVVHTQASRKAFGDLLLMAALLSINLALLNLLPIPALDGGHVFFSLFEMLFRRPVPPRIQEYATIAGFGLMLLLMAVVTANDIYRWIFV